MISWPFSDPVAMIVDGRQRRQRTGLDVRLASTRRRVGMQATMFEAEIIRTVAVVAGWATVVGGLLLAVWWVAVGGMRAFGPNDQLMVGTGLERDHEETRSTSWSSVLVGVHGFFGISTASLLTYAAVRSTGRQSGYIAVLVVAAFTVTLGVTLYVKGASSRRPSRTGDPNGETGATVEQRLPRVVVWAHGLAAAIVVVTVSVLIVVD